MMKPLTDQQLLEMYDRIYDEFDGKLRALFAEHGHRLHPLLATDASRGRRSALRCVVPADWRESKGTLLETEKNVQPLRAA